MREKRRFVHTISAGIHIVSPIGGGEHTLCGIAGDAYESEGDEALRWRVARTHTVTCRECISVVEACRGVRIFRARSTPTSAGGGDE